MNIDPAAVTLIQTTFLQHITTAFTVVAHYALNLLYLFAALELAMFGIGWALQQDMAWGKLFFKVIKIGLIFLIIQNYPDLLSAIINSFAVIAGVVIHKAKVNTLVFNPAQIWQYGYNFGLYLLQNATATSSFGLTLILAMLGMGVLFVFALLGIQVVLQLVGFYFVALVGLIFLPLGIFAPSRRMFDRAVQTVLQAGVKVMTVMIIIGIAAVVWDGFALDDMSNTIVSLNQSLGLFFSALLFLFLAISLPRLAATAVGEISSWRVFGSGNAGENSAAAGITPNLFAAQAASSELSSIQAAVTLDTATTGSGLQTATAGQTSIEVAAGAVGFSGGGTFMSGSSATKKSDLASSSIITKDDGSRGTNNSNSSISPETLQKLKEALAKL